MREKEIREGDIVRHFKREWVTDGSTQYLYKVLAFAQHTETEEQMVVYRALYPPFKVCVRPYEMFMMRGGPGKVPRCASDLPF